jgi:hypothetical protein
MIQGDRHVHHRFRFVTGPVGCQAGSGVGPEVAGAGLKDAAATKVDNDTMNNEFLMADFPGAEKKLNDALKTCGAAAFSESESEIAVHLGIVQVKPCKSSEGQSSFEKPSSLIRRSFRR